MMVFVVVAGLFPAVMDFLSSFVACNYEYAGQSQLWGFTYIFWTLFATFYNMGNWIRLAQGCLSWLPQTPSN